MAKVRLATDAQRRAIKEIFGKIHDGASFAWAEGVLKGVPKKTRAHESPLHPVNADSCPTCGVPTVQWTDGTRRPSDDILTMGKREADMRAEIMEADGRYRRTSDMLTAERALRHKLYDTWGVKLQDFIEALPNRTRVRAQLFCSGIKHAFTGLVYGPAGF